MRLAKPRPIAATPFFVHDSDPGMVAGTRSTVKTDRLLIKAGAIYLSVLAIFQLLLGADGLVVAGFCFAAFLGVAASAAAGGFRTIIGALCLIHVLKVLLVALLLKSILLETVESNLFAPVETAGMLAWGYASLLLASLAARFWLFPSRFLRRGVFMTLLPNNAQFLLALGLSFFLCGTVFSFIGGAYIDQAGGGLGLIKTLAGYKGFCVSCFIFYSHAKGRRAILLNPLVMGTLVLLTVLGVISTSKQGILEPAFFAGLAYYSIRGFQWKRYLILGILAFFAAQYIINPFTQTAKMVNMSAGGRSSGKETLKAFAKNATDSSVREDNIARIDDMEEFDKKSYFNENVYILSRLALVYEQSWLVSASVDPSQRSGWFTIDWGFDMLWPRFLKPDKPAGSAAPWLGSFSGITGSDDDATSISFGYMANFYNAFGNQGVVIGGFLTAFFLFLLVSFAFGFNRSGGIFWVFGVTALHHNFVEAVFSSLLPLIYIPFIFAIYCLIAWVMAKFLMPSDRPRGLLMPRRSR